MFERSLIPTLLAGLLAVGCSTARAQETGDQPEPAVRDESVEREVRERQAALSALRPELQRALKRLTKGEAQLKDAQIAAAGRRLAVVQHELEMLEKTSELAAAKRHVETELAVLIEDGAGEDHARARLLREKLEYIDQQRVLALELAAKRHADLGGQEADLRTMEGKLSLARRAVHQLRAQLAAAHGAPLPPALGEVGRGGPRGPGPRSGLRGPQFGPDGRRPPRSDERGVEGRLARLERTVAELTGMLERHGFPENRRQRALGEMDRRRRDPRGAGPRRGPDPRFEPGERRESDVRRGPDGPRGGSSSRGERRRPPPDTGATRAEAEVVRRELDRARDENSELRRRMEEMRRQMDEMRRDFEGEVQRMRDRVDERK